MRRFAAVIALFVGFGTAPAMAATGHAHARRTAEVRLVGDLVSVGETVRVYRKDCPSVASASDQAAAATCKRRLVGTGIVQSMSDPDHAQVKMPQHAKIGSGLSLEGETLRASPGE